MPASICRRASRRTAGFIELAASRERRDQRRADAGECVVLIVETPLVIYNSTDEAARARTSTIVHLPTATSTSNASTA